MTTSSVCLGNQLTVAEGSQLTIAEGSQLTITEVIVGNSVFITFDHAGSGL